MVVERVGHNKVLLRKIYSLLLLNFRRAQRYMRNQVLYACRL